jgi:hypothetical protein
MPLTMASTCSCEKDSKTAWQLRVGDQLLNLGFGDDGGSWTHSFMVVPRVITA